jgi:hypothetical protein
MIITLPLELESDGNTLFISSITILSFLTFRILHASSRSIPSCFVRRFDPEMPVVAAFDPPFAAAAALLAAA